MLTDKLTPTPQSLAGLDECFALMASLPADKLAHFQHLLQALVHCYTTEQTRALVLVSETPVDREQVSLIAVNANEDETKEFIDTLCVFRQLDFVDTVPLN